MQDNIESFLQSSVPDGVEVSSDGANTEFIIAGLSVNAIVLLVISGLSFLGSLAVIGAIHSQMIPAKHGDEAGIYGFMGLFALFSFWGFINYFRAWKTKTVVRVDASMTKFFMFTRAPWGEGRHFEFSMQSAEPQVRRRVSHSTKGGGQVYYYLEVYPTPEEAKAGVGFFHKNPNVFIVKNWNLELCDWTKRLILSIQGKKVPPPEREPTLMKSLNTLKNAFQNIGVKPQPPADSNDSNGQNFPQNPPGDDHNNSQS